MVNKQSVKKAYFTLVEVSCGGLLFLTALKYYVIYGYLLHTPLTSLMLDKSRDFKIDRNSSMSNYTYSCKGEVAPPRLKIQAECERVSRRLIGHTDVIAKLCGPPDNIDVQKVTPEILDKLSREWEDTNVYIKMIHVASSPLEGPYQSSPIVLRDKALRQWTGGDFHAFIVIATSDNVHLAFEKNRSGIYVSRIATNIDRPLFTVVLYFGADVRSEPLTNICRGSICGCDPDRGTGYLMQNLTVFLKSELNRSYSFLYDNCQSFAKRIFEEVMNETVWDPLPPTHALFDSGLEYYIELVVEVSMLFNNILVYFLTLKEGRKHIKFVCFAYILWLTSTDVSKICMNLSLIPNYFAKIFISVNFLLRPNFSEIFLLWTTSSIFLTVLVCLLGFGILISHI